MMICVMLPLSGKVRRLNLNCVTMPKLPPPPPQEAQSRSVLLAAGRLEQTKNVMIVTDTARRPAGGWMVQQVGRQEGRWVGA